MEEKKVEEEFNEYANFLQQVVSEDEKKDKMTSNWASEIGVETQNTAKEEIVEKLKGLDKTRSLRLVGLRPTEFPPDEFNQKVASLISDRFLLRESVVELIIRIAEEDGLNAILQFRSRVHRNLILSQENKIGSPFGLSADVQTPQPLPIKQKQTENPPTPTQDVAEIHSENPEPLPKPQLDDFEAQKKQEDVSKKLDQTLEPEGLNLQLQDEEEEEEPKTTQLRLPPRDKLVVKIPPAPEKPEVPPAPAQAKQPETTKEKASPIKEQAKQSGAPKEATSTEEKTSPASKEQKTPVEDDEIVVVWDSVTLESEEAELVPQFHWKSTGKPTISMLNVSMADVVNPFVYRAMQMAKSVDLFFFKPEEALTAVEAKSSNVLSCGQLTLNYISFTQVVAAAKHLLAVKTPSNRQPLKIFLPKDKESEQLRELLKKKQKETEIPAEAAQLLIRGVAADCSEDEVRRELRFSASLKSVEFVAEENEQGRRNALVKFSDVETGILSHIIQTKLDLGPINSKGKRSPCFVFHMQDMVFCNGTYSTNDELQAKASAMLKLISKESHKKKETGDKSKESTTKDKEKETKKKSEEKSKTNRNRKDSSSSKSSKTESYELKIKRLEIERKRRMERESVRGRVNSPRRQPVREETWKPPRRRRNRNKPSPKGTAKESHQPEPMALATPSPSGNPQVASAASAAQIMATYLQAARGQVSQVPTALPPPLVQTTPVVSQGFLTVSSKPQPIMTSAMGPPPSVQVDQLNSQVAELQKQLSIQQQMFKQQQTIRKLAQQLALTPAEDKPIPEPTSKEVPTSRSSGAKYRFEYKVRKTPEEERRPSRREKRRTRFDDPPAKKLATETWRSLEKEDLYRRSSQQYTATTQRSLESNRPVYPPTLSFSAAATTLLQQSTRGSYPLGSTYPYRGTEEPEIDSGEMVNAVWTSPPRERPRPSDYARYVDDVNDEVSLVWPDW